ncbi:AzlD domain-containing protein [Bordetella sp. 15P40C-2]|uniref:AzlD domain-containing protein n=1 Tax=Bordetella sp. 15P40C-2 TaxID=2572246 RepID=UPI001327D7FF|nr:AzlD domain-containing protein [Bordetella sp. 15P40C-2]MVW70827.1 AzlD domain-containing protein [Bordetella sp. 15P40C-2]
MSGDTLEFWAAVMAMAVITYLTRSLPFLLSRRRQPRPGAAGRSMFTALGPALLAGIATAVIVPDILALETRGEILPYAGGLLATAVGVKRLGNAGFAVILGVIVYGVLVVMAG